MTERTLRFAGARRDASGRPPEQEDDPIGASAKGGAERERVHADLVEDVAAEQHGRRSSEAGEQVVEGLIVV
jgi:hypothetical protein